MRWMPIFLAVSLVLCGCRPTDSSPQHAPIVRQIVATEETGSSFLRRYYNTDPKMQAVLVALRALRPKQDANRDVEALRTPTLCLTLLCSDGSEQLYRIKENRYLQSGTGTWKKVDAGRASALWQLIADMESDPEPPRSFHTPLPRLPHNWVYPYGKNPFFD